jgi:hypothetical protein
MKERETPVIDPKYRDQVVGLLIHGSATRPDFAPTSDIDLLVVLDAEKSPPREYVDGGLFTYDYFFHTQTDVASPDFVLTDPYFGAALNQGVIVSDPIGLLARAKALVDEKYHLPEYRQKRVQTRLKEMKGCLTSMRDACRNHDRATFYLQYYLFGYRLLSIPMIVKSLPYSQKRSFCVIQTVLEDSPNPSLAGSVVSALNVEPMPEVPYPQILSDLEAIVGSAGNNPSAPTSFALGMSDCLAGTRQVLSEGLRQDSLWQCFVAVSAMERNAQIVSASDVPTLQTLMIQVGKLMRIDTWEDIERTVVLSEACAIAIEDYSREIIEG